MEHSEPLPERLISPASLATLVLLGGLALGAIWLRTGVIGSEQWPIRWLDVEGELVRTSASQIRSAAIGPASRGFFAADLVQVRSEIEALPWIARAEVSRHWPDALLILVEEHRPIARWNESALFSAHGEVFEASGSQAMQGLPRLSGSEAQREEVWKTWHWMRAYLLAIGADVSELTVDQRGAWTATLDSGVELKLGREQVRERLLRFVQVHDELRSGERRAARIDLRYTNGLSVRWAVELPVEGEQHG
ncbi:MAG: cell division protein FtsQ/DivIB [Wenzhouxiangella sp.]